MKLIDEIKYRVYTSKYKCLELWTRTIEVRDGVLVSKGKDGSREVREDELLDLYDATDASEWVEEVDLYAFIEDLLNTLGECSILLDNGKMLQFVKEDGKWTFLPREDGASSVILYSLSELVARRIARALVEQL